MGKSMKKANALREMERLYYLRAYSDKEMGDALGIDRTLAFRYRKELSDPPNNLKIIKDENGRWKLDRMQYISSVRLNRHEALMLYLSARRFSQRGRLAGTHLARALEKLAQTLKHPMTERLVAAADEILQRRFPPDRRKVIEKVTQAWVEGRKLRITYQSLRSSKPHRHVVSPYLIEPSPWSDSIYLIGRSEAFGDVTVFKIERIQSAFVSGEMFDVPEDFDEDELLKHAWGIWRREGEPQTVRLKFAPGAATRRLKESTWHPLEQVTDTEDGGCIWEAPIAEWREMLPWVRGWGSDCEVLAPPQFRKMVFNSFKEAVKIYEKNQE